MSEVKKIVNPIRQTDENEENNDTLLMRMVTTATEKVACKVE